MKEATLADIFAAVSVVGERISKIEIALTTVANDQAQIRARLFEATDRHGKRIHDMEHRLTNLERDFADETEPKVNGGG